MTIVCLLGLWKVSRSLLVRLLGKLLTEDKLRQHQVQNFSANRLSLRFEITDLFCSPSRPCSVLESTGQPWLRYLSTSFFSWLRLIYQLSCLVPTTLTLSWRTHTPSPGFPCSHPDSPCCPPTGSFSLPSFKLFFQSADHDSWLWLFFFQNGNICMVFFLSINLDCPYWHFPPLCSSVCAFSSWHLLCFHNINICVIIKVVSVSLTREMLSFRGAGTMPVLFTSLFPWYLLNGNEWINKTSTLIADGKQTPNSLAQITVHAMIIFWKKLKKHED